MGYNFIVSNWAYASSSDGTTSFVWSPTQSLQFPSGGGAAMDGQHATMSVSGGNYLITDYDSGEVHSFDMASRLLASTTTAGGQITANLIVPLGGGQYQIAQTSRSLSYTGCGNSLTTTETLSYSYFPNDGSASSGLLQYVTLSRTDSSTIQIRRLAC